MRCIGNRFDSQGEVSTCLPTNKHILLAGLTDATSRAINRDIPVMLLSNIVLQAADLLRAEELSQHVDQGVGVVAKLADANNCRCTCHRAIGSATQVQIFSTRTQSGAELERCLNLSQDSAK